jgi:hypothetical protein
VSDTTKKRVPPFSSLSTSLLPLAIAGKERAATLFPPTGERVLHFFSK